MSAGDTMIEAIAEAVALRLERYQSSRRRLLDMEQAAEYLGMSDDGVQRLIAEKRLIPARLDRRLRFDIRDLDQLIEESKSGKSGGTR